MNHRPVPADTLEELGRLLNEDPGGDLHAWFDTVTYEVILTTSTYDLDEDDDEPPAEVQSDLPEWMQDERRQVAAISADDTGRYLRVPIGVERGAPGILHAFAKTVDDDALYDEIRDAMRGRGAFRRVKDVLYRHGKMQLWNQFEDARYVACALEWLREEGVVPEEEEED